MLMQQILFPSTRTDRQYRVAPFWGQEGEWAVKVNDEEVAKVQEVVYNWDVGTALVCLGKQVLEKPQVITG